MYIPTDKEQAMFDATETAMALPRGSKEAKAAWEKTLAAVKVAVDEIREEAKA